MADWVELPGSRFFPQPGELVRFKRGDEFSEPLRVHSIDPATKTVYFSGPIPSDVVSGDELVSM